MIRPSLVFLLACVCALALGQKAPSIVGTWVPDKVKGEFPTQLEKLEMKIFRDGTFSYVGFNTVGNGTYKVEKGKLTLTVLKRNGSKPTHPSESRAEGRVIEGGKAILLPTGQERNGVPTMMRLVRKK